MPTVKITAEQTAAKIGRVRKKLESDKSYDPGVANPESFPFHAWKNLEIPHLGKSWSLLRLSARRPRRASWAPARKDRRCELS